MKTERIIITICVIVGVALFLMGMIIGEKISLKEILKKDYKPDKIPDSEQEILDNCEGLNLKNTAYCWRDNIETFFNYEYHSDILIEDFSKLKETGGDCTEWSYLYKKLAEESNIKNKRIIVEGIQEIQLSHMYLMIWDEEFKCKLDQLSVECEKR